MAGPLINARQRERVLGYIEKGKAEGARAIVGGGPATQFEKGYFVQPTLFVDVDPDSTIAQEEIFGPVLSVIPFDDDDDAVRIANNSRYGLSGGVTSASLDRALGVARRIRTGTVVGERRPCGSAPTHPSAATRRAAKAASTASPASRNTSRPRPSASPANATFEPA